MEKDFSQFLIKEYDYWKVYINKNQSYLGRCYLWCKREDALDLTDTTEEEQDDFFIILNELKKVITELFSPDWFNYAFLGNETRHLHCHFVPRYKKEREFMGIVFKDKYWGHHYRTDKDFKIPDTVLFEIKRKIKKKLNN